MSEEIIKPQFDEWWKTQAPALRRDTAVRAGTSDEYVCKYLLTKLRVPRPQLVKRIFHCLPSGHPFEHQDLVNFFFKG